MINEDYRPLFDQLRSKMNANEVIWSKTSSLTQFKLFLDNYTIIVDQWMGHSTQYVKLEILNSSGDVIGGVMYNLRDHIESYSELSSFYSSVQSYYRTQVTTALSGVMGEISKSGKIGKIIDDNKK